jgi:hypothetical protein
MRTYVGILSYVMTKIEDDFNVRYIRLRNQGSYEILSLDKRVYISSPPFHPQLVTSDPNVLTIILKPGETFTFTFDSEYPSDRGSITILSPGESQ